MIRTQLKIWKVAMRMYEEYRKREKIEKKQVETIVAKERQFGETRSRMQKQISKLNHI